MHELSITRNIVATVAERARGRTITGVTLKIGELAGIELQALRFCFDVCAEGTCLEGATLNIESIPGRGRCVACDEQVALSAPIAICPCERRARLIIEAGEELLIHSMEVN
ncbi:hydrogenase maturation nickel metallochaperone HypA [Pseudenhygromyxa sp. WMMC2535]|uniref:hydrogenase maturation nickel metallochaperone HypA/HybF n=1 Tax=Pseudenhygromyxa sp. WMMC2535 TaxID=2712867 RepID=UPI001555A47F|nr:hydrogenase maturation nickel metallochaperone HypA [Pseudenhygromyxa sp. WMMC2535]NVB40868.1 hydrogenase maturation nickel metallochaperone HypA [Pseudenhygromyxa sp. WMMC2535]